MKLAVSKISIISLLFFLLLTVSQGLAQEQQSNSDKTTVSEEEIPIVVPDLAEIIPLATKLTKSSAELEKSLLGLTDFSALQKSYSEIEVHRKGLADQLVELKDPRSHDYNKLVELREKIKQENALFEKVSTPLSKAIDQLGLWRKEWLTERENWKKWRPFIFEEQGLERLEFAFKKANSTIDQALKVILANLETMLFIQEQAGNMKVKIDALGVELDNLIADQLQSVLFDASVPMLSFRYFNQFSSNLWYAVERGVNAVSLPNRQFYARQGWICLVQGLISLIVIIFIYRNRQKLRESKSWHSIVGRPFSTGIFLGYMMTVVIYEYHGTPSVWKLTIMIIGGISFARLFSGLIETCWKKRFVYGLVIVFLATRLMIMISLPIPLLRLYTVLAALFGMFFCLWWTRKDSLKGESNFYLWLLRVSSILFASIIITEFCATKLLGSYLLVSLLDSVITIFVFLLAMHMIRGFLEWLFHSYFLRKSATQKNNSDAAIRKAARLIDIAICGLVLLPAILMIWGVYDSLEGATKVFLEFGFNVGSQKISIGLVYALAGIIYGTFLISWVLQKLIINQVLVKRHMEKGVRYSIARLVHYVTMLAGFLVLVSILGVDITKLTIILSALGVGIGFGLQSIVNDFISGLILLFEGPVRVGDTIELADKWAEIKKIGLRSTTVKTFDEADVIIPNSDLISKQVTNWTLGNRRVRIKIPVGVAYGSNITLVMKTLADCSKDHEMVNDFPPPQILFMSFGESSLDFELRVWVTDADHKLEVVSELHQEIDQRFREAEIEIAFPQRDLHLRSSDESAILRILETNK